MLKIISSLFLFFFCFFGLLGADGPQFWTAQSVNDFLQGQADGISIMPDESLVLAPGLKLVVDTGEPFIWGMAPGKERIFIGTGHDGKVMAITATGDTSTVYDALEPETMALTVNGRGDLFIGASPEGRVYRIPGGSGNAETFFDPEEKYIWALVFGPKGDLYVAVGIKGRVYKVSPDRKAKVVLDSDEQHIISLALDRKGNILAGSSGNACLYQIDPEDSVSILFESPLKDIRSIVVDSNNNLFLAAFELQSPAEQPKIIMPRPEATAEKPSDGGSSQESESSQQARQLMLRMPSPAGGVIANSEIYFLDKDRFVTRLWRGSGEAVISLGITKDDHALFVSGKDKSNLYALDRLGEITLLTNFQESEVTGFLRLSDRTFFCTSNMGKIYELEEGYRARGSFTSQILNAGIPAEWGSITWEGEIPPGTDLYFRTRSGNTSRPDTTWSPWSAPYRGKSGESITSPPRVNFQWEAVLTSSNRQVTSKLNKITVSYLCRNRPPMISPIRFMPQGVYVKTSPAPPDESADSRKYPYEAAQVLENKKLGSTDNPFSGKKEYRKGLRMAGWNANDSNDDRLRYNVYYRGINESTWRPLAAGIDDNSLTFSTETMADGRYVLKVTAYDSLDNPGDRALLSERTSPPFVVDNSAPLVADFRLAKPAGGNSIEAAFLARDEMSRIERAEISLDAGDLTLIFPVDGIADSQSENYSITFPNVSPGEHTVTVQVYDAFNNMTASSRTIKLP